MTRKLALACALWLAGAAAHAAETSTQLEKDRADLARVQGRIAEIGQTIQRDQSAQNAMQADVEAAERRLALAREKLATLQSQLSQQRRAQGQVESQRSRAQADVDAQREVLRRELRAAYLASHSGAAAMVLFSDDPGRAGRLLAYFGYLERARAAAIATLQDRMSTAQALAERSRVEAQRTAQLSEAALVAASQLREQRAERAAAVANMRIKIAGESQELKSLRASESQTQHLIESLNKALADVPFTPGSQAPFPRLRGRLQWPLKGPLLARFGQSKAEGRLQWKGIWIGAPEGAPVRAVARGRVAYTGWLSRYGLIVVLQHEDGYFTLYGHATSVSRSTGEWVNAGEPLATAGTTGGYDQPGIYLEIRKGTEAVDPSGWLAGAP